MHLIISGSQININLMVTTIACFQWWPILPLTSLERGLTAHNTFLWRHADNSRIWLTFHCLFCILYQFSANSMLSRFGITATREDFLFLRTTAFIGLLKVCVSLVIMIFEIITIILSIVAAAKITHCSWCSFSYIFDAFVMLHKP